MIFSFAIALKYCDSSAIFVDVRLQVQHYLKLSQETLYISISLLDTILEKRDVEPDKLQLVGITALYLGSKMEEYYPADVKKLLHLTENSYTVQDVFDMELVLLGVICFQVKLCCDILSCKFNLFQFNRPSRREAYVTVQI